MNTCGTKPSTLTIAAAAGPYAKPAIRHTMPDGSYLRNENAGFGRIGNEMKLVAIASATNSAYMAMRRVDQRPESATPVECAKSGRVGLAAFDESAELGCEDTLMVSSVSSIRTLTVGSGFPPDQPLARVAGCRGRRYESRLRRSPPVRNCTFPETCLTMYTPGCG